MKRRRVLVAAYHFPPLGGGGVQRWAKHVRYLPEHGWDPVVLTTRSRAFHAYDDTLGAELPPELRVLRAGELLWGHRLRAALARLDLPRPPVVEGWPDRHAGWIPAAVRMGLKEIRRERPDAIATTSPVASAHVVGLALHRLTGVPWVADFRDEFVHHPWAARKLGPQIAADRMLERAIVANAARVVVTTDAADLVGMPHGHPRRVTVTNGVDPADLPDLAATPERDVFRLSFVGSLYHTIDLAPVLASLARLAESGLLDPARCEVRIVGNVGVPRLDAGAVPVVRTGYVEHPEACREMARASVLLCYVPPPAHPTPGKVFEYLATGRPILCATGEDNHAWQLVSQLGAGRCADPRDPDALDDALSALYREWQETGLPPVAGAREAVTERFSRRRLTGAIASTLEDACSAGAPLPRTIPVPATGRA